MLDRQGKVILRNFCRLFQWPYLSFSALLVTRLYLRCRNCRLHNSQNGCRNNSRMNNQCKWYTISFIPTSRYVNDISRYSVPSAGIGLSTSYCEVNCTTVDMGIQMEHTVWRQHWNLQVQEVIGKLQEMARRQNWKTLCSGVVDSCKERWTEQRQVRPHKAYQLLIDKYAKCSHQTTPSHSAWALIRLWCQTMEQ